MRAIGRLVLGLALLAGLSVLGHMALTSGTLMEGHYGRFAAGTCAACH